MTARAHVLSEKDLAHRVAGGFELTHGLNGLEHGSFSFEYQNFDEHHLAGSGSPVSRHDLDTRKLAPLHAGSANGQRPALADRHDLVEEAAVGELGCV